jgi:Domain of unknown function (DUF4156)
MSYFLKNKLICKASMVGAAVLLTSVSACTWVKVTAEGQNVKVLTAAQATSCERLGTTSAKAVGKLGFVKRNEEKLQGELQGLARNEAAVMGGNAVVADSAIENGSQRFVVYRCP